jgi:hypothetical protein
MGCRQYLCGIDHPSAMLFLWSMTHTEYVCERYLLLLAVVVV